LKPHYSLLSKRAWSSAFRLSEFSSLKAELQARFPCFQFAGPKQRRICARRGALSILRTFDNLNQRAAPHYAINPGNAGLSPPFKMP
jgi:hypothetical protein